MYYDSTILLIIPALLLALWAQASVKRTFDKYSREIPRDGRTAAQIVRAILDREGLTDIKVERAKGDLTDHYDPRAHVLRLSAPVHDSASIAAIGVAAHEAGHALQQAQAYAPLVLRNLAVPTVNFGSQLSWPIFLIGLLFSFEQLLWVGIAMFALVVAFSLITLPVEFNASSRAMAALEGRYLNHDEASMARKVLNAAAMTYVASAVSAILHLIRLFTMAGRRRR